ncbi:MAG TPA: SGNH/GDSL hydrolase family protein [Natronosporangium sp.]
MKPSTEDECWIDSWAALAQPAEPAQLPPPPFTHRQRILAGITLRQTIRASVGGDRLRLRISNAFGGTELAITAGSVALPLGGRAGVSGIEPGTARPVTFRGGAAAVTVPAGGEVVSDPVPLRLPPRANLSVTLCLAGLPAGEVTCHPGSRTTSYLLAGDHAAAPELAGGTPVDHWYFLSGLQVPATAASAVAVVIGDSLTDGRGSTTNGNDRWPDRLLDRLHADPSTRAVAMLNHGLGGSRLLDDGLGAGWLDRLVRNTFAPRGLRWLVLFKGINDIGTTPARPVAQRRVAADLIQAYEHILAHAHRRGVRVYGATLLPFGGHPEYDDPQRHREQTRQAVNQWIRTAGRFDAVLDFDRAVRDPAAPDRLLSTYDSGDRLHLNPAGYRALADAVPTRLFAAGQSQDQREFSGTS